MHPTLGYKFNFTDNSVTIAKSDLKDTGLATELPLSLRIKNLLRTGAMTAKQITESLDANEMSVRTVLNRMTNKRGILIKIGETWGLKQEV